MREMIGINNISTIDDLLILIVASNHPKLTNYIRWQVLTWLNLIRIVALSSTFPLPSSIAHPSATVTSQREMYWEDILFFFFLLSDIYMNNLPAPL